MVSRKIEKDKYGPGWGEVIFGAVLSLVLGAALALGYLVVKPVVPVDRLPKEPAAGTVYYVAGSNKTDSGKQWMRKKELLTEGSSVTVNEDDLNAWIADETAPPAPAAPAPGQKPAAKPAAGSASLIELGTPNFRIHDGLLQIGSKGTLNIDAWGVKQAIFVQVAGRFEKHSGGFVFAPDEFYIGSCPLHRVPGLGGFVLDRLLAKVKAPDDIAAAWKKLADVSIEGKELKLTMP
ncbi:MAG TPA: hypothetical protein VMD31_13340 [Opitutaceae bacterium]|nr:hypothetical protein [Opitutaceae bacterium]